MKSEAERGDATNGNYFSLLRFDLFTWLQTRSGVVTLTMSFSSRIKVIERNWISRLAGREHSLSVCWFLCDYMWANDNFQTTQIPENWTVLLSSIERFFHLSRAFFPFPHFFRIACCSAVDTCYNPIHIHTDSCALCIKESRTRGNIWDSKRDSGLVIIYRNFSSK